MICEFHKETVSEELWESERIFQLKYIEFSVMVILSVLHEELHLVEFCIEILEVFPMDQLRFTHKKYVFLIMLKCFLIK